MTTLSLPFARLNLRQNPFGHVELGERAELAVVRIDPYVQRLAWSGYAVQFIGDQGYGKTTHLLAIQRQFPDSGYVHFAEGEQPPLPGGQPLLIDECQRVPPAQRSAAFHRGVPLVLGTHVDFSLELRAAGYEVETVDVGRQLTLDRLHELLDRRIHRVRRAPGPVPGISRSTVRALWEQFGPNIRAIEMHLYEVFQQLREPCHV